MSEFKFTDDIKKIFFFGGNIHMISAISIIQKEFSSVNIEVLLSKRHLSHTINENTTLEIYLKTNKIKYSIINSIEVFFDSVSLVGVYGMSFGSPWIFKKNIIKMFEGKLINFHNDILPNFRGAASVSWRILMGSRVGSCTCHLIDEGIDSGDIIYQEPFIYENKCRLPIDYELYLNEKFKVFFYNLMCKIKNHEVFNLQSQQSTFEEYWPRLNTDINGYIDWNLHAYELDRFICAFDKPYNGASTFLKEKKCFLRNVILDFTRSSFHSFQYGLVYKKNALGIFVSINGGTLIIREVLDENRNLLLNSINVGDRFYTLPKYLSLAKEQRVFYDLNGLKNKEK